ncbi:MAG: dihydroorotate dehydrogenase (quinone) [Acidobacteriota bacterium]
MLYRLARPFLFSLDAERAHGAGKFALQIARWAPGLAWRNGNAPSERLALDLFSRTFAGPIGLAAGFDKDAEVAHLMPMLGFGFVEVGTVTPQPQQGNPRPRIFRHPEEKSLQNRLGFNNAGLAALEGRLDELGPLPIPLGINIGKNKDTPADQSLDDYRRLLAAFGQRCDYLVVNVSSPNTPGLRDLQTEEFLRPLFESAREFTDRPVLVKIAPDMEPARAVDLCAAAVEAGAAGVVATNTTADLDRVPEPVPGGGGLSGRVLTELSFEMFEALAKELFGKATLISVGGIGSGREAYRRIRAGASLVQLYTALVFKGPDLLGRMHRELEECLDEDGFENLTEVIGADRNPSK